jgi:lipid II:glycine glycyltransferase (peptidoglycan interpeptide bridge formation enzyme)
VVYKYGCSDGKFHAVGGMPFLFWRLIEESKASGVEKIDFGRSELDNEGLITFKDRLGTRRKLLTYYKYTNPKKTRAMISWESRGLREVFSSLPDIVLSSAGSFLYKHLG